MSTEQNVRLISVNEGQRPGIIVVRGARNMCHKKFKTLYFKQLMTRKPIPDFLSVTVAAYSHHGLYSLNLPYELLSSPEVTAMPDDIHRLEKAGELFVKNSVSIAD